ncbi:MAG: T9SS type A sorting domain-containing protein [Paludibacteraceae bacterium]
MKENYILLFVFTLLTGYVNAQVLLEEKFNYSAGTKLIANPVISTGTTDETTGWTTQSNTKSAVNAFDIVASSLGYNGLVTSEGNALKYTDIAGQSVFKLFPEPIVSESSTFYMSFIIKYDNVDADGSDYFFGVKMESSPTSTNWGSRLFATIANGEVTYGISKTNAAANVLSATSYSVANTHFVVIKYKIGILNGTSSATEAGNYDDEMTLYVNPAISIAEPGTPTLFTNSATDKDILRWGSTKVFGGAAGVYLRSPANGGASPVYTIDEMRVGKTWSDVVPVATGIMNSKLNVVESYVSDKVLTIKNPENTYSTYKILNLNGQIVQSGSFLNVENQINVKGLNSGLYILTVNGKQNGAAKILIN